MRIHKKVLSNDSGNWLICCWQDCEKQGFDLYNVLDRTQPLQPVKFVFCSERHRQYWLNSSRDNGNLPVGMKGMIG